MEKKKNHETNENETKSTKMDAAKAALRVGICSDKCPHQEKKKNLKETA